MEISDRPVQHPDVVSRVIDGQTYILDPAAGELHALNPLGARIYELLDGQRTIEAILAQLLDEYDVTKDVLDRDALSFLHELEGKGLVLKSR
jgi:hypothetical protein